MNDQGQAKTSDVITASQWILDNKAKYNIRVANFSLHSSYSTNFYRDPLDQAVEKLWFNGVVVVAAAGNYGIGDRPVGRALPPGNDPFVITVGAVDIGNSVRANDDTVAPWSAYGYTPDGFYKPDVAAPGPLHGRPDPGRLDDRGAEGVRTSSAPTGSSSPARRSRHRSSRARRRRCWPVTRAGRPTRSRARSCGRHARSERQPEGGRSSVRSRPAGRSTATYAPNPNVGLERFLSSIAVAPASSFDAMSWANAAKSDMSWNSMSWNEPELERPVLERSVLGEHVLG